MIDLDEMVPLPGRLEVRQLGTRASAPLAPGLVLALWRVVPESLTPALEPTAIRAFR